MQALFSDPLTLAVLALVVGQSLISLIGGIRQQHSGARSETAAAQTRLELVAWGIIPPEQDSPSPAARSLLLNWLRIAGTGRIGMGIGMLLAAGAMLLLLVLSSASGQLSPLTPPVILASALLLQGYAFGMCCGAILGLLSGIHSASTTPAQATAPARPAAKLAEYRVSQVALLPDALLLIDVALVGGLDLLFLPQFTQTALWSLAVFPGMTLLACALGEWFSRRLARLPLRLADDPVPDERSANRLRARLVGMLLERELFALFILVACQWLLQTFSQAHSDNIIYVGALPVYAVILLSMRGLLERAHLEMLDQQARQTTQPSGE
jgi:hypothetical protein